MKGPYRSPNSDGRPHRVAAKAAARAELVEVVEPKSIVKEPRVNKRSNRRSSAWANYIVPFTVKPGSLDVDLGQFVIRYFPSLFVPACAHILQQLLDKRDQLPKSPDERGGK
jgi:hypothetical protein